MSRAIREIYERLVADGEVREGSQYEVLAGFVWKILDDSAVVVHDVDLRAPGHWTVNQIDLHITAPNGMRGRVVIECRDKDPQSAHPKVDQDEARSFATVANQLRRDEDDPLTEAIMLTTVGYTSGAANVAVDEDLALAVLEPAHVIREIHLELNVQWMGTPRITAWVWPDEEERNRLVEALGGPKDYSFHQDVRKTTFFNESGSPTETYQVIFEPIFRGLTLQVGPNSGRHEFEKVMWVELEPGVRAAVRGFEYEVDLHESVQRSIITAGRQADQIAELVLRSLDDNLPKRVITAGELKGLEKGFNGEIRLRSA